MAPITARSDSLPPGYSRIAGYERYSDAMAEEAFASAQAPQLTWEWGEGFRLAGKPVADEEASRWDWMTARQVRACGEESHKRAFEDGLRDEFHQEYGPRKALSIPLPLMDSEDQAAIKAWEDADRLDVDAWLAFRAQKKDAGMLPDWYLREIAS